MIQITPQMRILLGIEPIDFRKGIDGIAGVCRNVIAVDPFTGCVFVFRNRLGTSLKILMYDGQGFWLCQKRFSRGRLNWWPQAGENRIRQLTVQEFQILLWNGNPEDIRLAACWKPICSFA